jgi:hypothetical protein
MPASEPGPVRALRDKAAPTTLFGAIPRLGNGCKTL